MSDAREDFVRQIQRRLASLPPEEQHEATLQYAAIMMKYCDRAALLEVRAEVVAMGDAPIVADLIEVIDGHLALRDISARG